MMVEPKSTSNRADVLIPSYKRPRQLLRCLVRLRRQTRLPDQVLVVAQGEDQSTVELVNSLSGKLNYPLKVLHCAHASIVDAANLALEQVSSDIVFLCDDDSIPPVDWIAGHLELYGDPSVGAVGGAVRNYYRPGKPYPLIDKNSSVGHVTWFGRVNGFHYDHSPDWRHRPMIDVDHLHGANMSLRRSAFSRFEAGLKSYWQCFEMDACFQVKCSGYRVVFNFASVMPHFPKRAEPDCSADYFGNWAYNEAFVLSKHTRSPLRMIRLLFLLIVGSRKLPGLFLLPMSVHQTKRAAVGWNVHRSVLVNRWRGWRQGAASKTGCL